ncbi:PE family protein [Nocardia stercoris]|uniref:PE family protein n=1 Tax=Nocardia stercoris TaxID=2483361 RepID=A0A3M2L9U0_9NOCA|nr:PE family protein [Nocardia stercoris]RMI34184.1 PE family protein [Nocardia stercoris]
MFGLVNVSHETIEAAATELELLADRLTAAHAAAISSTDFVVPSGAEEVSIHAAAHLSEAGGSHTASVTRGIFELQNAAATLRAQLAAYNAHDDSHAAGIAAQTATITEV